ncbi:hypothetical protein LOZ66_001279 [Ophidiomyces ophidiicola]|nr:hypothetical protein LOZ66_001279 [Ophidiomyces ophidiicola]
MADDDADDDDYMAMAVSEPAARETLTQRRRRQLREAEARARVPSKAERAAAAAAARDAALATSALDPASKGFQIMARLGYTAGSALGRAPPTDDTARDAARRITEPLPIAVKDGRGGVGLDSLRKRRLRDQLDGHAKRLQTDQLDFRARARLESDARRAEAQFRAAQAVAEGLDLAADEEEAAEHRHASTDASTGTATATGTADNANCPPVRPRARVNLLYRGLVRARELQRRDAQAAHRRYHALADSARDLASPSASRAMAGLSLPAAADDDLDPDDKLALGRNADGRIVEPDDESDDPELDDFSALPPQDRLARLVRYLRDTHCYCFWCKCRYDSPRMDGCPGLTEDDHD